MSIKQVKLATQAKEQLMRLKTRTGIPHWNVLCRWAFCLSLRQASPPAPLDIPTDSNVEMTWQVFGGDAHELYLALLKERCERDGLGCSDDVLARQFRLHLHRGIGYLAAPQSIRSIVDLIKLATEEKPPRAVESSSVGSLRGVAAHPGDLRSRLRAGSETLAQQRRNPFAERRATMRRCRVRSAPCGLAALGCGGLKSAEVVDDA